MDPKFVNVLILGFGFMFLFTAFQTMGNIEVRWELFYINFFLLTLLDLIDPDIWLLLSGLTKLFLKIVWLIDQWIWIHILKHIFDLIIGHTFITATLEVLSWNYLLSITDLRSEVLS